MIKYNLLCGSCSENFDSWFASSKEFEKLKKLNLINCPNCKSFDVKKSLKGIETIAALNAKMQELLNNNQVVGISLKKIKGTTANLKLINEVGKHEIFDIKFVDLTAPSESTSGYINMTKDGHKMKINFRNF